MKAYVCPKRLLVVGIIVTIVVLSACIPVEESSTTTPPITTQLTASPAGTVEPTESPEPTSTETPEPTLSPPFPICSIISPADGAEIEAGDVTISIKADNFMMNNGEGKVNAPGQGYIHYYMDVEAPNTPYKPAFTEEGTYAVSTETSYTWHDVQPGIHTFSVELVNNDHSPVVPPVVVKISVSVMEKSPGS